MDFSTLRNLGRFKEILVTLARFGFDEILERLELPERFIPFHSAHPEMELPFEERLRLLLEDLGPTFIKLGQVLSLRPDLVPPKIINSLRKLQDQVAPVDFEDIKVVVEESLKCPLEEVFTAFEREPLASASMGQVHRAVLRENGMPVAVKVLKPGIRQRLAVDVSLLEHLAETLEGKVEALQFYDLPGIVRELTYMLKRELDLLREARNMSIARANMRPGEKIRIPIVYEKYTRERVLTMEIFVGQKLSQVDPMSLPDRKELSRIGLQSVLKQILEDGFFHADPHPGNVIILDGGVVGLIDWGMVGRLTRHMRFALVNIIQAVGKRDSGRIIQVLLKLSDGDPPENMEMLEREILDALDAYTHVPMGEIKVGELMSELTNTFREHGLRIPAGMATVVKALLSGEGAARMLFPELDVIAEAEPIVRRLVIESHSPRQFMRSLGRTLENAWQMHSNLPGRIDRLLRKAEHGDATIKLRHENLAGLRETLDNASNRLSLAVVLAAMFLGSSIIITTDIKPYLFGYPAMGVIGYIISGVLGLWLIVTIIRRRKY